jgi:hypothetical protein
MAGHLFRSSEACIAKYHVEKLQFIQGNNIRPDMQKIRLQRPSGQKAGDNRRLRKTVDITIGHNSDDSVSLLGLFILWLLSMVTIYK